MLQVKDLRFKVAQMRILDGVTFEVAAGEKLGLIGPNGSGKTTLFNCLSGFNMPTGGSITFKNQDITHLAPAKRSRLGLGRVFQSFGVFKQMTLQENIITALEGAKRSSLNPWSPIHKENKEKAIEFLKEVKLEAKAHEKAGSLSGGQMRLLEISRTIAFGSDIFLLDEPTAGVSPRMKGEIEQALIKLQSLGKTIITIEHDMNFIQKLSDRILVLDMGRVILDDTPEKVRANPLLQDIYFGSGDNGKTEDTKHSGSQVAGAVMANEVAGKAQSVQG